MTLDDLLKPSPAPRKLLCLEVNPPRGANPDMVFQRLETLKGVHFFNVTDCALAKMRLSAIPFASLLKQRFGIEVLVNFSCRDRNGIALQSDLLGAWALGVRSIVALTGDAVSVGDMPQAKGVFEVNSIGLLGLIEKLNSGKDSVGNDLSGATSFVRGAVVNPNAKNISAEIKRLQRKKDAGATYALSQPVFDVEQAKRFFEEAGAVGIDVLVGLLPFKSSKSLEGLSRVPGIKVPESLLSETANLEGDISKRSFELCSEIVEHLSPAVRGFHVISGATPKLAADLTQYLVKSDF